MDAEKPKNVEISVKTLQTMTIEGYFRRFYEILPDFRTNKETWEALEADRIEAGLPERYSSYESFRSAKCYHLHAGLMRVNSDGEE